MAQTILTGGASGLSGPDLLKLKHFVIDSLTRELETDNPPLRNAKALLNKNWKMFLPAWAVKSLPQYVSS
jgi:hypothetical protein